MNAAIPERRPATEEISGLIERVTFHNDESGFCVLRVKARGQREETTVVGSLPSVSAGEWLIAEGWWVRDKEHGLQFKATTMKTVPPTTVAGLQWRDSWDVAIANAQLIEEETENISVLLDPLIEGSADPVPRVRTRAQQDGMVGAVCRLEPRCHLPRLHRIHPVIVFSREKENRRIRGSIFYMVVRR